MTEADFSIGPFLWQRLRPAIIGWAAAVLPIVIVWGVAYAWVMQLADTRAQLEAERRAAAEQLQGLQQDVDLIAAYRERYARWREQGLIGELSMAERRALWLQQLQAALARWSSRWASHVELTLEPGVSAEDAAASATTSDLATEGAAHTVTHHPLSLTAQGLTDIESLAIVQLLQREWGEGARLEACQWQRRTDADGQAAVELRCRARLTYIHLRGDVGSAAAVQPAGT